MYCTCTAIVTLPVYVGERERQRTNGSAPVHTVVLPVEYYPTYSTLLRYRAAIYCVANEVLVLKKKIKKKYYCVFAEALTGDSEKAPQYFFIFFCFLFIIAALFQSPSHRAARQCFLLLLLLGA